MRFLFSLDATFHRFLLFSHEDLLFQKSSASIPEQEQFTDKYLK